jgi:type III restriction enzyme
MRPFQVKSTSFLVPKKYVLNKISGDSNLELEFAVFLERCSDVVSYIKNYFAVSFRIDYINSDGEIKDYYPDFIVKLADGRKCIIETKGREDVDDIQKIKRLRQWCDDVNKVQETVFFCLYVKEEFFKEIKGKVSSIKELEKLLA